jgi:hypothetical protein
MYLTIQIIGVLQITVIITAQHTLSSGNLWSGGEDSFSGAWRCSM